ncbi:MobH family relaxase [Escherichia coli]|uniref:MobH family relaxase n=1 Tax=Escherichia coli TaxID=562 RepID=UPI00293BB373|nr:MobH family relaxase [Escherichia coli]
MNFRALYLCIKRILGIFSSQENDATSVMIEDISSLSPFAQILGDQKYTVPDHPNPEVLKFIEYPTRPTGIQTFNEQSILSLYREKLHSISMMLAISDSDIRDDAYTFTNLVLKPLVEYVRWIHLLPASENHHHNGIGGLLSHSLEVAILSLKNAHHSELRPIGYQDEEVVRRKVYLYAAFICGLVHDAGKVYDLDIVSLNLASPIIWTPSSQSLLDWARENDVVEYEIHWRKRIHNQHNIWSSVFLERILNPVCLAFLDRVNKERVYSKMITALNVYTDGNDFLSKCVRTADFYSTGTDLNVLRDPIMGLRSNDAAAGAISTIKHNFTSININNYNAQDGDMSANSRISIFVDEAHSAINNPMINLLAQGRAAKIALFICTQTISDFIAAASVETANRITGLCNNYISLRVNDTPTQTLVVENFGKSAISTNMVTYTTGSETSLPHNNFSGSISERKQTTLEESIPKDLLGQVPMFHIVARLQDGRKVVGQIPIAVAEKQMKPNTTLSEMLFKKAGKVTLRQNLDIKNLNKFLRKLH